MSLFTERERSLIFSWLKKSSFLKSMLLLNFLIQWYWNILYLFNISMMLNNWIIQWFWVDVTTKALKLCVTCGHSLSMNDGKRRAEAAVNLTWSIEQTWVEQSSSELSSANKNDIGIPTQFYKVFFFFS